MSDRPGGHREARHTAVAGSSRIYAMVLLLVVIFIVYGSLFQFEYYARNYSGGAVAYLLSTWRDWDHRGDLLSNIMLYLPLGFFGTNALPQRISPSLRAPLTIIGGIGLSCAMELVQFHDAGRVSSMGDVYADAIGSGIGAVSAALIGASVRWPFIRELSAHPVASVLLVMFFGYRLYPYVPVIDLHKYWHAVRLMVLTPDLPPYESARYVITWLFIAVIIHSLYGYRRFLLLFPLLCGCEFVGKVLIFDGALKLTDVVGAAAAYLLWALLLRWIPGRFVVVALAFAGIITAQRLEPFQFAAVPHDFGWVPFAAFMRGSINVNMQAFCEKFYEYGGLIWLLNRAGVTLSIGVVMTATLLFATSYAECWLPERSAEITDALMAVMIGGAFALLRRAVRGPTDSAASDSAIAQEHA